MYAPFRSLLRGKPLCGKLGEFPKVEAWPGSVVPTRF